ncbi:MAG TPA: YjbQ family protein [Archangium sp.]|uniref:YjbQ family protein n=1 Tax=Archangium sp. TaxID=1872627 RepID=UPI002E32292A|nr:YjbQ family protein [Archangium sp.]HEX5751442.1 YjbQ family protein [Archangium sp.]
MVLVSAMHITAGVFVNDDEPGLHEDIWDWLQTLAPQGSTRGPGTLTPSLSRRERGSGVSREPRGALGGGDSRLAGVASSPGG